MILRDIYDRAAELLENEAIAISEARSEHWVAHHEAKAIHQAVRALNDEGALDARAAVFMTSWATYAPESVANAYIAEALSFYGRLMLQGGGLTKSAFAGQRDCELVAAANLRYAARAVELAAIDLPSHWSKNEGSA